MPPSLHYFLLFLLVCDWVGDPYQGKSPLSRSLGSQEVACPSLATRATLRRAAARAHKCPAAPRAPARRADRSAGPPPAGTESAHVARPSSLYLFMSLR